MRNLMDYRMFILTKDNHIKFYDVEIGKGHDECLNDFANKCGYSSHRTDYLVSKGNSIFYNVGNNMSVVYLPNELDEDRLYTFNYVSNWLYDVKYMEVSKQGNDTQKEQEFILNGDVCTKFSNEVIQSYYEVKSKRK